MAVLSSKCILRADFVSGVTFAATFNLLSSILLCSYSLSARQHDFYSETIFYLCGNVCVQGRIQGGGNGAMAPPLTQKEGANASFGPTCHLCSFSETIHLFMTFSPFFIDAKAHIHFCSNMTMALLNHPPNFCVENQTVRPFHRLTLFRAISERFNSGRGAFSSPFQI